MSTQFKFRKKENCLCLNRRIPTAQNTNMNQLWASTLCHQLLVQGDIKKRELLKTPTKIEEIQEKKIIDRNWTITTCLLRDSNPNYQYLKITSCRWRPPPRMHSFTATTHFKSSRSFVSPCVCCMLCRMRLRRILQSMQRKKTGTFEKPNKNWRNPRKKIYWQKLNHYNFPFKRQ